MRDQTSVYTIDEALSSVQCGIFQVLILIFAGISWLSEAMEINILSFIGPAVKSHWSLSPTQESLLSTAVFFGMLVGSFFWGFISDSYGRRMAIRSMIVVIAASGLLSSFSPNYITLVMVRSFLGFGATGCHIMQSWLMEFIPITNRGAWVLFISAFFTFGEILEACLAWIIMPRLGWKWLLAISSLPSFIALIFSSIIPESPRYLYAEGRVREALQVLKDMARINRTQLPDGDLLVQNCTGNLDVEEIADSESTPTTPLLASSTSDRNQTCLNNMLLLFSSEFWKTTSLLLILTFANNFLFYGNVLMISAVSSEQISKCKSNLTILFENFKDTTTRLYRNVLITSSAEFPGLVIATIFVDRLGRKVTMGTLTIVALVVIAPLTLRQNETVTMVLLYLTRMSIYAVINSVTLYGKEVYPTSMRNTGSGLAIAVGKIGGMICPLVAVGLVRGCHLTLAVIMFGFITLISGICVLFLPFETKGKELIDIVK